MGENCGSYKKCKIQKVLSFIWQEKYGLLTNLCTASKHKCYTQISHCGIKIAVSHIIIYHTRLLNLYKMEIILVKIYHVLPRIVTIISNR